MRYRGWRACDLVDRATSGVSGISSRREQVNLLPATTDEPQEGNLEA